VADHTVKSIPGCTSNYEYILDDQGQKQILGKGAQSVVYLVRKRQRAFNIFQSEKQYALKVPRHPHHVLDLNDEVKIMKSIKGCPGVMPLRHALPCIDGANTPGAFVSDALEGDLTTWLKSSEEKDRKPCLDKFHGEMTDAMRCVHERGFTHLDIKLNNVLYKERGDLCPTGLHLADFGLAKKTGTSLPRYRAEWFKLCTHIPFWMFQGRTLPPVFRDRGLPQESSRSIGIRSLMYGTGSADKPGASADKPDDADKPNDAEKPDDVVVHPLVDMCSYKLMLMRLFQDKGSLAVIPAYLQLAFPGYQGYCGKLGYGELITAPEGEVEIVEGVNDARTLYGYDLEFP